MATGRSVVDAKDAFKTPLSLSVPSSSVWVSVYGGKSTAVDRINLGQQAAGSVSSIWDGKDSSGNIMPPGTYRSKAQISIDGKTYGLQTHLPTNVDSVTLGQNGGGLMPNLAGLGSIALPKAQIIGQ